MPLADLLPMAAFALVMSITPGPNNIMLLNSGLQFGVRRSMPHVLGITVGFAALIAVAFGGVAALVLLNPAVMTILTLCGGAYMFWLAWRMLRSTMPAATPAVTTEAAPRPALQPMTFWGAGLFQFVNPKGWAAAVAAVGITARWPLPPSEALAWLLGITVVVNLPSILIWTTGGALLRRLLAAPALRRGFDIVMAALVVATALWMLQPLAATMRLPP